MTGVSRFQLLRGDFQGTEGPIRPPYAKVYASSDPHTPPQGGSPRAAGRPSIDDSFTETCTRAGACARACEAGLIRKGRGGFPQMDFSRGECTFCLDCVRACASGALALPVDGVPARPWPVKAVITDACLARRGVHCRTCGDECPVAVIRFRLAVGGVANPEIETSACTGCGACVGPCPVSAVRMEPWG